MLRAALVVSVAFHLVAILALGFELPDHTHKTHATPPLEVLVLRDPVLADEKPEKADALAQVNQVGGGSGDDPRRTDVQPDQVREKTPEPAPGGEPVPEAAASEPAASAPPEQSTLAATLETAPDATRTTGSETPPPPPAISAGQILASRNLEIAKLTARIEETGTAYANRPRRKAISASTREYKYATYLEAWRRKVERIGNLNYPEEAKRRSLYGNLILHVAVRADGSLEQVRVVRSSGFDVLDEAAVRIVKLAAPFAPLPPDIRAETDILDITRTWQFLSSNRLGWEN
jgi:periplasmic protein TonB